jgi:poly(ADP-ribose) glycohydrolase ARH3
MNRDLLRDRAEGCLLGLAIGDAFGAPHEGGPPGRMTAETGWTRVLRYTDDTEMAIGVAEALAHNPDVDREFLAERFVANYTAGRGYGFGTRRWIEMVRDGASWAAAARAVFPDGSFGNGAAMRVAPVAVRHPADAARRRRAAEASAEVTHQHPLARAGAVVLADAVAFALADRSERLPARVMLDTLAESAPHEEFRQALRTAREMLARPFDPMETVERLGNGVEALRSVPAAIYVAVRHSDDYTATVRAACGLGGDADTIAAMAGAITGAHVGRAGLPPEAVALLENAERIADLARLLADAAGTM